MALTLISELNSLVAGTVNVCVGIPLDDGTTVAWYTLPAAKVRSHADLIAAIQSAINSANAATVPSPAAEVFTKVDA